MGNTSRNHESASVSLNYRVKIVEDSEKLSQSKWKLDMPHAAARVFRSDSIVSAFVLSGRVGEKKERDNTDCTRSAALASIVCRFSVPVASG
jgi:hypothetical protein